MADRLQQALDMASRGFLVFPLRRGTKEPFGEESWKAIMTRDAAVIRGWFAERPDMNYGVNPGPRGVILDLDFKPAEGKDGGAALAELQAAEDPADWIPDTLTGESPSGGRHVFLGVERPAGNGHDFPKGIDTRGIGGYVVGPGSVLIAGLCGAKDTPGDYRLLSTAAVAPAPQWVAVRIHAPGQRDEKTAIPIAELDTPEALDRARAFLRHHPVAVEGQGGDNHTFVTAGLIKDLGVSEPQCFALLLEPDGWNARCLPPWDGDELATKVHNAYRYGQNAPGNKSGSTMIDAFVPAEAVAAAQEAASVDPFAKLRGITFLGRAGADRDVEREMVIPDWLPAHGFTAFLAYRGTGKTVAMLDIALRLGCDMDWHGISMDKDWVAVYLCAEDSVGATEHMDSWIQRHQVAPESDRFVFLAADEGVSLNMMDPGAVELWTRYVMSLVAGKRVVLFVDTWQRVTQTASQNDDVEMNVAVHHLEAMARSLRGPAIVAFHPPKDEKKRGVVMGSSVIENESTAIWVLDGDSSEGLRLAVERIKGRGKGSYGLFEHEKVPLIGDDGGQRLDKYGNAVTGIVPKKRGGSGAAEAAEMSAMQTRVRAAYAALIHELLLVAEMDPEYQRKRERYFTLQDTAQRVVAFPEDHPLRKALYDAGERNTVNPKRVAERLSALFKERPSPEELPNGVVVEFLNKQFRMRQSMIAQTARLDTDIPSGI